MASKAPIDANLRESLKEEKKRLSRGRGLLIEDGKWEKGVIRLLPSFGKQPARSCRQVYDKTAKQGVTLPSTFGYPDPLWDYIQGVRTTGDKDEKAALKENFDISEHYWAGVIVRGQEGTPENPNVRVMRLRSSVWETIVDMMVGDEDNEQDVTDPKKGRDFLIIATGTGLNRRWKAQPRDPSSISKDPAMRKALVDVARKFNVIDKMFEFKMDTYAELYMSITNNELPEDAVEALQELEDAGGRAEPEEYSGGAGSDADEDEEEE